MNIYSVTSYDYNTRTNFKGLEKGIQKKATIFISPNTGRIGLDSSAIVHIMPKKVECTVKLIEKGHQFSLIQLGDNAKNSIEMTQEDWDFNTDAGKMFGRMFGADGIFQFTISGTDKKVQVIVPAADLTKNMKIIDLSMQNGTHPFIKDMVDYLHAHPYRAQTLLETIENANVEL